MNSKPLGRLLHAPERPKLCGVDRLFDGVRVQGWHIGNVGLIGGVMDRDDQMNANAIEQAIDAAERAFQTWSKTAARDRSAILRK
jgi:hypothetical protein